MEKEEVKKDYKLENDAYKERFQFYLSVNDNIICQRYFKINGFNNESLESLELKETLDECVQMIQQDLVSKSRIFMWYTRDEPLKFTGFTKNSTVSTYFTYPENTTDKYSDNEKLNENEVQFKFTFSVDNKPVYEHIWDGTVYPKYVRNGVDLTNSDVLYRDREPLSLHFSVAIVRYLTNGRNDLVYHIIKKICEVMSFQNGEVKYTKSVTFGEKYFLNPYPRKYVNSWREYVKDKTDNYFSKLYPSQKKIEYIDNKL